MESPTLAAVFNLIEFYCMAEAAFYIEKEANEPGVGRLVFEMGPADLEALEDLGSKLIETVAKWLAENHVEVEKMQWFGKDGKEIKPV